MCGIAGIISKDSNSRPLRVNQMISYLRRRGPDAEGVWNSDGISLGHTRLKIIDLSVAANQPMIDSETGNAIIFNGEIYNYLDLKDQLIMRGCSFNSNSDTEVLLKGFKEWGIKELLIRAEGMFAFGIFSISTSELYLARDRFGKKPLYYGELNNEFIFSSDIRAIKHIVEGDLRLNDQVLDYYFHEYAMPQPHTIYQGIYQLEPASYKVIDACKASTKSTQVYWKLDPSVNTHLDEKEALMETERLLKNSISKRMVSDVPLGFFLSGGIDSGLNVALASEISTKKIKTFSVGFSDDHSDELAQAKLLSTKFGTDHHEIRINPDIQKIAKEITAYVGEPFADYSLIPNALICEALRSKATVAISGDGGDELFGGYRHFLSLYQARYMLKKYGRQLAQLKVIGSKPLSRILPSIVDNLGSIQGHLKIKSDDEILIRSIRNINSKNIYHHQFSVDSSFKYDYVSQFRKTNNDDIHTVQQILSLRTLLLNDYLVKVDRASMYNSLEVRSPFLDHHLAEFAFTIPNELKFKGMNSKYLLRKLATNKFGRNVMKEPKKGFVIPMQHWLRKQLKPWVTSMLLDSFANRQIIDPSIISVVLNEHMDKGIDHGDFIWKMVALEIWFQECN